MSRSKANAGALALVCIDSPNLGDFEDAMILKTFGEVPEDFGMSTTPFMIQRKGELGATRIDREWLYQVAVPADQFVGKNSTTIEAFYRRLSLCPRGHTV